VAHGHNPNRPDNWPESGPKLAEQANRHGVADRVPEPAGPKRMEVDRALIDADDRLLTDLE
jgi:hypothetical protein